MSVDGYLTSCWFDWSGSNQYADRYRPVRWLIERGRLDSSSCGWCRFTIGAEARNGNTGFGFKLGGAKSDGGYEEFYGQINAKYVF